jgi:predicted transcriptional regulator of viral defense system
MSSDSEITHLTDTILSGNKSVYMNSEFNALVRQEKSSRTSLKNIKEQLSANEIIKIVTMRSEGYKDIERIAVPALAPTPYHYAISLRNNTYLSHASAVNLIGLTEQIPHTIYVNREQSPKNFPKGVLQQEAIDRAFSRPQRQSKYVFSIDKYRIVLLSGKSTNNEGVEIDPNLNLPRTNLERTLIDIAVRPRYAGGVFQVLQAFTSALQDIDYDKLLRILDKLDYTYPYHQSLGFYLDRAGADSTVLSDLKMRGTNFKFYLDYSMANPSFDSTWMVYYPLGI